MFIVGLGFLPTRHLSSIKYVSKNILTNSSHIPSLNSFSSFRASHHTSVTVASRMSSVCYSTVSTSLPCTNPSHMHLLQRRSPSACPYHSLNHKHDTSTYLMCFIITLFSISNRLSHVLISTILNNQSNRHM